MKRKNMATKMPLFYINLVLNLLYVKLAYFSINLL